MARGQAAKVPEGPKKRKCEERSTVCVCVCVCVEMLKDMAPSGP